MIRGEIVAIPIVVFNYINKDLSVEVVLENNGDFEFAEVSNEVHETKRKYLTVFLNLKTKQPQSMTIIPIPLFYFNRFRIIQNEKSLCSS